MSKPAVYRHGHAIDMTFMQILLMAMHNQARVVAINALDHQAIFDRGEAGVSSLIVEHHAALCRQFVGSFDCR